MEEVIMRAMKMVVTVFACVSLVMIFAGSGWAGEWSDWAKVERVDCGDWNTYIVTTVKFPSGKFYIKVDREDEHHNRIVSLALTALSLDLDVRFFVGGAFATRISIKNQ
jgi:hypothetical protein